MFLQKWRKLWRRDLEVHPNEWNKENYALLLDLDAFPQVPSKKLNKIGASRKFFIIFDVELAGKSMLFSQL